MSTNLEKTVYNPENPADFYGVGHNAIVKRTMTVYADQIAAITDKKEREAFILRAVRQTGYELYGDNSDFTQGLQPLQGPNGLIGETNFAADYKRVFENLPLSPESRASIIRIFDVLTTYPIETEEQVRVVLNVISEQENELLVPERPDMSALLAVSVTKFSLVCWWADPNPTGEALKINWGCVLADAAGAVGTGTPMGAAAASTVYHLCFE